MEIKKIATLDEKSKDILGQYWFMKFGGLMGQISSPIGVREIVSAIEKGWIKEDDWKEVAKQKVYIESWIGLNGKRKKAETSPFNDEFITNFWDKLKPLMEKEQIEKLKKYHKKIE